MNIGNKVIFQKINSSHSLLKLVIKDSIGFPIPEKITEVLKSYELSNHFLIGAFLSENLIGVIGYTLNAKQAIIKHISVLESFRDQGVGKGLVQALIQDCAPNKILLETDEQSVDFYKKLGFDCESFEGKPKNRYHCHLDLASSCLNQESITSYQDINEILFQISNGIKYIMPENLIGIYLTGSLSYGDFNPDNSDIDLIVIVKKSFTHTEIDQLKLLHRKIELQYPKWAQRLECSYTPVEMFKNTLPPKEPRPYYGYYSIFYEGALYGDEWIINNYLLYKHGISLIGPDIKDLISTVDIIEVKKACVRNLFQEWAPKIEDIKWLDNSHCQSYLVMNLCRILYTVICGRTSTKRVSAAWVKKEFGNPWQKLIETAENWRYGKEMNARNEAVDFLKFVINEVKKTEAYRQIQ